MGDRSKPSLDSQIFGLFVMPLLISPKLSNIKPPPLEYRLSRIYSISVQNSIKIIWVIQEIWAEKWTLRNA